MATVGLAAGALAAGIGGALISSSGAKKAQAAQARAQAEIARQNLEFQRESRDINIAQFEEARDAGFGNERDLVLDRAGGIIRAISDFDPGERLSEFRQFLPQAQESLAGGAQTLADIFSGRAQADDITLLRRLTTEREAAFDLVGDQRLQNVEAGRTALDLGLENAISRIDAGRVSRGFRGSSTFDNNRIAKQFLDASQGKAILEGNARLANALGRNRITEDRLSRELALPTEFRNLQLLNLAEPLNQFSRQAQGVVLPEQLLAETFGSNIRSITGALPNLTPAGVTPLQNTFQPQLQINSGQILGAGLGALSQGFGTVGQLVLANQQNNALTAQNLAFQTQTGIANNLNQPGSGFTINAPIAPVTAPVSGVNFNVVPPAQANTSFTANSITPAFQGGGPAFSGNRLAA